MQNAVALLRVNKAQFGTVVYLNGTCIGEHDPCFTSATFDITSAIHWNTTNELVIRIGAHPGVLPDNVVCGTDFEKHHLTPGIYDDVTLTTIVQSRHLRRPGCAAAFETNESEPPITHRRSKSDIKTGDEQNFQEEHSDNPLIGYAVSGVEVA